MLAHLRTLSLKPVRKLLSSIILFSDCQVAFNTFKPKLKVLCGQPLLPVGSSAGGGIQQMCLYPGKEVAY